MVFIVEVMLPQSFGYKWVVKAGAPNKVSLSSWEESISVVISSMKADPEVASYVQGQIREREL